MRVSTLYLEYSAFVRRSLRLQGLSGASVEDALQDVFLVALRRLDDFEPRASHKTWLYAISARVAKDYRRRFRRKGGLLRLEEVELPTAPDDPLAALTLARRWRSLQAQLSELDPKQRDVFVLAELEEMTVPEIARALQINLNTVYSRLRSARRCFGVPARRATSARRYTGAQQDHSAIPG